MYNYIYCTCCCENKDKFNVIFIVYSSSKIYTIWMQDLGVLENNYKAPHNQFDLYCPCIVYHTFTFHCLTNRCLTTDD